MKEKLKIVGITFSVLAPFLGFVGWGVHSLMPYVETELEQAGLRFGSLTLLALAAAFLAVGLISLNAAKKENNNIIKTCN
jgi:hypothetical protein